MLNKQQQAFAAKMRHLFHDGWEFRPGKAPNHIKCVCVRDILPDHMLPAPMPDPMDFIFGDNGEWLAFTICPALRDDIFFELAKDTHYIFDFSGYHLIGYELTPQRAVALIDAAYGDNN